MLKHIVLIKFKEEYDSHVLREAIDKMEELPRTISQVITLSHGRNIGVTDDRYDYGLVVEFESVEAYQAYITHPEHRALGAVLNRLISDVAQIQFED